jgi:hypothetical protein
LRDAADFNGNIVREVEEGNASVQEWWGADERKQQKYSFKY